MKSNWLAVVWQMSVEELAALSPSELQAQLKKAEADMADLLELRDGFFGQTGVHIGARILKSQRQRFERDEANLRELIYTLKRLLEKREGG